jgi:DNA repair exonuclease SbcCD ATPase subunit
MKSAKSSITRLKKAINEKLPSAPDIYGFQGINRELLVASLDETYGLLEGLSEKRETFDVIFMKRKLAELTKACTDYLKDDFLKEFNKEKKFDGFLNCLFSIRKLVKETYLLVVEESLSNEAHIHMLREDLGHYKEQLQEYLDYKDSIDESASLIKSMKKDLEAYHSQYEDSASHIESVVNGADQKLAALTSDVDTAESEVEQIIKVKNQIIRNKVAYQGSLDRFKALIDNLELSSQEAESQIDAVKDIKQTILDQQTSIQNIIDDANRASMAGSFKKRKDELDSPIRSSWWIMIVALVFTTLISGGLLVNSGLLTGEFKYVDFLIKVPVIAPFIWIAWSSSQRNNYLVRIQEDYAFKYASAMAFEGYKKQVQEIDSELEKRLLVLSVENMGMNPIRLFDKQVKCSPLNDAIHSTTEAVKTMASFNKKE